MRLMLIVIEYLLLHVLVGPHIWSSAWLLVKLSDVCMCCKVPGRKRRNRKVGRIFVRAASVGDVTATPGVSSCPSVMSSSVNSRLHESLSSSAGRVSASSSTVAHEQIVCDVDTVGSVGDNNIKTTPATADSVSVSGCTAVGTQNVSGGNNDKVETSSATVSASVVSSETVSDSNVQLTDGNNNCTGENWIVFHHLMRLQHVMLTQPAPD